MINHLLNHVHIYFFVPSIPAALKATIVALKVIGRNSCRLKSWANFIKITMLHFSIYDILTALFQCTQLSSTHANVNTPTDTNTRAKTLKMVHAGSVFWWGKKKKSQEMLQWQFLGFKSRMKPGLLWYTVFLYSAENIVYIPYSCVSSFIFMKLDLGSGIRGWARNVLRWLFFILLKKILTELANSLSLLAKKSQVENMSIQILPWRVQKWCTQVSWHWHNKLLKRGKGGHQIGLFFLPA